MEKAASGGEDKLLMRLIFLGPPGAGKGTQAKVISERMGLAHISTGNILREAVKNNSPVGLKAQAFMEKGELVPDEVVIEIVVERLAKQGKKTGFILDGFPRTAPQAVSLEENLKKIGQDIDYAVYFDTTDATSIARLSGRRVCRACGINYHIKNMRPKIDGRCDVCGGQLYQRQDDKVNTIKNRLKVYKKQTKDLTSYYEKKGILKAVSGDLEVEEVFKQLSSLFNKQGLIAK